MVLLHLHYELHRRYMELKRNRIHRCRLPVHLYHFSVLVDDGISELLRQADDEVTGWAAAAAANMDLSAPASPMNFTASTLPLAELAESRGFALPIDALDDTSNIFTIPSLESCKIPANITSVADTVDISKKQDLLTPCREPVDSELLPISHVPNLKNLTATAPAVTLDESAVVNASGLEALQRLDPLLVERFAVACDNLGARQLQSAFNHFLHQFG